MFEAAWACFHKELKCRVSDARILRFDKGTMICIINSITIQLHHALTNHFIVALMP